MHVPMYVCAVVNYHQDSDKSCFSLKFVHLWYLSKYRVFQQMCQMETGVLLLNLLNNFLWFFIIQLENCLCKERKEREKNASHYILKRYLAILIVYSKMKINMLENGEKPGKKLFSKFKSKTPVSIWHICWKTL